MWAMNISNIMWKSTDESRRMSWQQHHRMAKWSQSSSSQRTKPFSCDVLTVGPALSSGVSTQWWSNGCSESWWRSVRSCETQTHTRLFKACSIDSIDLRWLPETQAITFSNAAIKCFVLKVDGTDLNRAVNQSEWNWDCFLSSNWTPEFQVENYMKNYMKKSTAINLS